MVVGFGGMGCRHIQSLLAKSDKFEFHIVEVSDERIRDNCGRIGLNPHDAHWYKSIAECPVVPDIAIIATSSGPRYAIVKELIAKAVKYFLLEKIVFQSAEQFEEVINDMTASGAKAWCNFVNRYFTEYNVVRDQIQANDSRIHLRVYGGLIGLGCNAIHYVDLFQYLSGCGDNIEFLGSNLVVADEGSRRGAEYKEFTGSLSGRSEKGDRFDIIADPGFKGGVTVSIRFGDRNLIFSEETSKVFDVTGAGVEVRPFEILPTSKLTLRIVEDMLNDDCRLTTVEGTKRSHSLLFNAFNTALYGSADDTTLCPIT